MHPSALSLIHNSTFGSEVECKLEQYSVFQLQQNHAVHPSALHNSTFGSEVEYNSFEASWLPLYLLS